MLEKYGVTRKDWGGSLKYNAVITLAGLLAVTLVGFVVGFKEVSLDAGWLLFYLVISVPVQEFVFRGLIQTELYRMGKMQAIIVSSALYALIHYPDLLLTGLTFIAGLAWGYSFWKKPTLIGPVVSHAILGTYLFLLVL